MNKYIKYASGFLTALVFILGGFSAYNKAEAYMSFSANAVTPATFQVYDFFASSTNYTADTVTWSATSTSLSATSTSPTFIPFIDSSGRNDPGFFPIMGAKSVTLYFAQPAATSTSVVTFYVQVTPDGVNWYPFNSLTQNIATTTQGATLASQAVTGTSTVIDSMNLTYENFLGIRCIVVVPSATSSASCKASAAF